MTSLKVHKILPKPWMRLKDCKIPEIPLGAFRHIDNHATHASWLIHDTLLLDVPCCSGLSQCS